MSAADVSGATLGRRQQRRLQHLELGRGQLLDAAEEVFGRKGYHDTTLKEIAELAEFSVGSVYSFFENKDDLFTSVFVRRGQEFMPEMRAVLDVPGTPLERLHRLVDFEVGFFRRHPHFGRLYLRSASITAPSPDREVDRAVATNFREAMAMQAKLFADGQRAKQFRGGDPAVLARLFSGLISAYQSADPLVVADGGAERLPVKALHDIVERAFSR